MSTEDWKSTEGYWENRYVEGQVGWDRGEVHPAVIEWLNNKNLLPCKILIPGCGNGYEVVHLASTGFEVTAVDFADTPVAKVNDKLNKAGLKANLIQADFLELQMEESFDAIYEQTCLCALEPSARSRYEAKVSELLKPNGKLFALFMQTANPESGPPFHCEVADMKNLFHEDRWKWQDEPGRRYEHPAGTIYEIAFTILKK